MNNEELQTRRQFFKKAAKGALPILAAVALASAPAIVNAAESEYCTCKGNCSGTCEGTCRTQCIHDCNYTCKTGCNYTCKSTCKSNCVNR